MKRILIPVLFFLFSTLSATTYYVSTSGSDSNNGLTTSTPWQTIQYAESHATAPGDIIALKKGDVWSSTTVLAITHGGASGNPITWDGSLWGSGSNASIKSSGNRGDPNNAIVNFITNGCHYVTFKNVIVDANNTLTFGIVIGYIGMSNYTQNGEHDITVDGCSILNVGNGSAYRQGFLCATWNNAISNITIQNCILDGADDEQLTFYCGRSDENATPAECSNIVIRNNTLTNWGRRGQSTGYGMQINNKCTNVLIEGNTLIQGPNGKGDAFHIESNEPIAGWFPTGVIMRYNKFSVDRTNEWNFIVQKGQAMTMTVYSNVFIHNSTSNTTGGNIWIISNGNYSGAKLNFYNNTFYTRTGRTYEDDSNISGTCSFKNNIIYHAGTLGSDNPVVISSTGSTVHSNNCYYRVGTGDNLLVSEGGSQKTTSSIQAWEPTAKKDDPKLTSPGSDFRLLSGSCAIGAGVSISGVLADMTNRAFSNPPSLGAYESSSSAPVVPVYVSSAIQNATPGNLDITYNVALAAVIPSAAAFSVIVNSVARTVNSVTISGTKVSLTLASPVVSGDVITVSYNVPTTNPIQSTTGGQAAALTAQSVTNNVSAAVTVPVYVSSVIQNATRGSLDMTYSTSLAPIVPPVSAFRVLVNSVLITVSSVIVSGTKVTLALATPVVYGDVITVVYTKPATNPLQTVSGLQAITLTAQPVTNNVNAVITTPLYVSSLIQNATPNILEMTYSTSLTNIIPSVSVFSVLVNSVARSISLVSVSGTTVSLTLSSPVINGDSVTVSYTKPATNPLQTISGEQVSTTGAQPVANFVTSNIIIPVYVSSVVQNASPAILEITYNSSLAAIIPSASAFIVIINSVARTVNTVSVSGTKISLTLASVVLNGDVVTIAYTKPATNPLQSASGGQAVTFSAQTVTNNITALIPVYVSSVIQNATPNILEVTYNLSLTNIVPDLSAFVVKVNSFSRSVISVAVSGSKVTLTLTGQVVFGDVITISYTKPVSSPLQTSSGGLAATFNAGTVTNNVNQVNTPPVVTVAYNATNYSGFTGQLDASKTIDPDKDNLVYEWTVPANVEVSSVSGPEIQFLAPLVSEPTNIDFLLQVSDSKSILSKSVSISILPYKPQLERAGISKVLASDFVGNNDPDNIVDNNTVTLWSAEGTQEWLRFELDKPYKIGFFELAFQEGQKKAALFDIYASEDGNIWEPILINTTSCNFAGGFQTFDMPVAKTSTEYSFIKLVGHGTSQDMMNNFSEFRIYGTPVKISSQVAIYPNPAHDNINVTIDTPPDQAPESQNISSKVIRIFDTAGKLVLEKLFDTGAKSIQIQLNLNSGVYIVQMLMNGLMTSASKLIVY